MILKKYHIPFFIKRHILCRLCIHFEKSINLSNITLFLLFLAINMIENPRLFSETLISQCLYMSWAECRIRISELDSSTLLLLVLLTFWYMSTNVVLFEVCVKKCKLQERKWPDNNYIWSLCEKMQITGKEMIW